MTRTVGFCYREVETEGSQGAGHPKEPGGRHQQMKGTGQDTRGIDGRRGTAHKEVWAVPEGIKELEECSVRCDFIVFLFKDDRDGEESVYLRGHVFITERKETWHGSH